MSSCSSCTMCPTRHVLHSGKTVIQHIYDSHYEGAAAAAGYVDQWKSLKGRIDEPRYLEVLARLEYQAGHAEVWRDSIVSWFLRTSGIPDRQGRAGHYPNRHEAEEMELDGYVVVDVTPVGNSLRREGSFVRQRCPPMCRIVKVHRRKWLA